MQTVRNKKFKRGDNLRILATYLHNNPGSTSTDARKYLSQIRDRQYRPGYYSTYFCARRPGFYYRRGYVNVYWNKVGKGWFLMTCGLDLVDLDPHWACEPLVLKR